MLPISNLTSTAFFIDGGNGRTRKNNRCKADVHLIHNIIVCGRIIRGHDERFREVLVRMRKHKVTLSIEKCLFDEAELDFAGINVSGAGV